MFNWGKKKDLDIQVQPGCVYATQKGEALPIKQMPDAVFAEKIVGDGICILPKNGLVYSPVSGKVVSVASACHAYGIEREDGAELLIHIGVDTVELNGSGFLPKVKQGDMVKAGMLLCEFDLQALKNAGMKTHTAVLLTNTADFEISDIRLGATKAGNVIFSCRRL